MQQYYRSKPSVFEQVPERLLSKPVELHSAINK